MPKQTENWPKSDLHGLKFAILLGWKKGEMAIELNRLVVKSVTSELENWVGGRKWGEELGRE